MSIKIRNKRDFTGSGVYVGRPSILGNPFKIGKDGNRKEVINKYRKWIFEQLKENRRMQKEILKLAAKDRDGEDLILLCWCYPLPCHAEVIKMIIERINKSE